MISPTARNLALLVLVPLALLYLAMQARPGRPAILSRWGVPAGPAQAASGLVGRAEPLVGQANPVGADPEAFHAGSALQEGLADGALRYFRRAMPGGGELAYVVVRLDARVQVAVVSADGATPASDSRGDTVWADGGRHLASVAAMAGAPYAARAGMDLIAAMAFGFHGAERTSDEGSVVVDGVVRRVNAGRAALCISPELRASIGLFSAEALAGCAQAAGAGPVILWQGQVASTAVAQPSADLLPFNPLGEDFVQLDWRKKIYNGLYPKTAIGVGDLPDGGSFLVLATSSGVAGEEFARALRDMGCRDALGGDDDTSTQATWRGQPVWPRPARDVPDAIAVYLRR
jgi:hypothetical protein